MARVYPLLALIFTSLLFVQYLSSCNSAPVTKAQNQTATSTYNSPSKAIFDDYDTWNSYTNQHINLSRDFIGLDTNGTELTKAAFLNLLETSNYIPYKVKQEAAMPYYRLYQLRDNNKDIRFSIKQLASNELVNYKMEGKQLPSFHWRDLQGNQYTSQNTRGKILVLKCWFIRCVACVQEFPELNELVQEHSRHKDVAFVSIAMDSSQALTRFLKTKPFRYAVVPVSEPYMVDTLDVRVFPTHIIVGRDGKIVHASNQYKDLEYALKKELVKR